MENLHTDYDVIIVGGGTAGLTAAIYCCRAGKHVLVLEAAMFGGQIVNTPEVENYPGIQNISGFDFTMQLHSQAAALGAELKSEDVKAVQNGTVKTAVTVSGSYPCKAVILACGAKNRPLGLENEQALTGRGVSYCATCDGMFFKGKTVAVVGGGNTALEDCAYLANICEKVYLIHRRDTFRGEKALADRLTKLANVQFILDSTVTALHGDTALKSIEVTNKKTGAKTELAVSGVFAAVGQVPNTQAFAGLVQTDAAGYIVAGEDCQTDLPGIFTAGDCRTKAVRQLTTAAADGAVAATAACAYCDSCTQS